MKQHSTTTRTQPHIKYFSTLSNIATATATATATLVLFMLSQLPLVPLL